MNNDILEKYPTPWVIDSSGMIDSSRPNSDRGGILDIGYLVSHDSHAEGGQLICDSVNTYAAISKHRLEIIPMRNGSWTVYEFSRASGVMASRGETLAEAVANAVALIEGKR